VLLKRTFSWRTLLTNLRGAMTPVRFLDEAMASKSSASSVRRLGSMVPATSSRYARRARRKGSHQYRICRTELA